MTRRTLTRNDLAAASRTTRTATSAIGFLLALPAPVNVLLLALSASAVGLFFAVPAPAFVLLLALPHGARAASSLEAPPERHLEATRTEPGRTPPSAAISGTEPARTAPIVTVRLVEPRQPWWAGRVTFRAEAESPVSDPVVRVEFFIDGHLSGAAARPPWRIDHDFREEFSAHRLSLVARTRSGATGSAQVISLAPYPQQHAGVELVLIPVSVRGPDGQPIGGLVKEDFDLLVDGVSAEVATFDAEPTPVSLVFGLDCSGSMDRYFPFVKAAAIRFIEQLPRVFGVSLLTFGDRTERACDFTFDRAHLFYEINRQKVDGSRTALLQTSRAAIVSLAKRRGRRAAAIFTDGEDNVVPEAEEEKIVGEILNEARAAGVLFYFIGYGWVQRTELLERIAGGTGGELVSAGSERKITTAFDRIARQLASQYTLGYLPPAGGKPGEWHTIRIELRRPGAAGVTGVTVSSRPGYVGP